MKQFYYSFPNSIRAFLLCLCMLNALNTSGQARKLAEVSDNTKESATSGHYIVVYKNNSKAGARMSATSSAAMRRQMMQEEVTATLVKNKLTSKQITQVYETAIKGFAISSLSALELDNLRKDDQVAYVVADTPVFPHAVPASAPLMAGCDGPVVILNGIPDQNVAFQTFGSTAIVSGNVVLVNDGSATPTFGCAGFPAGSLAGKIALIDRGTCAVSTKALLAQNAGAIGVIIANNVPGSAPSFAPGTDGGSVTIPVVAITLPAGNALKATLNSGAVTATLDRGTINSSTQCTPWGITRVRGGSSPVPVGKRAWIIDTGIDLDHLELNVNTTWSKCFYPGLTNPDDQNGHGTHVAGTIGARNNGQGVIGVAPNVELVAVRVFPATGGTETSTVIAGMNYVMSMMQQENLSSLDNVVNMSLGGDANRAEEEAVLALSKVCKVVLSAGNDATDANFVTPARVNAPNVYTVSAIDINGKLASFSNFGNAPVDFAAPGVNVLSTFLNGGYSYLSGTSMAAPHVTGLLLLGDICSDGYATGDPDGRPDRIAVHNDGSGSIVCTGVTEICGDGIDNDFDGEVDEDCCPAGNSSILYVKANATGANNGLSWGDAFNSLQSALSAASTCDAITRIWVAKGTYYPSADRFGQTTPIDPRTKSFLMKNNLAIYGGFEGNEGTDFDLFQRDLNGNLSILSGEIQQDNDIDNNVYHVFLNFPVYRPSSLSTPDVPYTLNETAVLDGFWLSGGSATAFVSSFNASGQPVNLLTFPHSYGAAIVNYSSSPAIRNCIFYGNQAYLGGGVANYQSSPGLKSTYFFGNYGQWAGCIYNDASSPVITNSEFQLNSSVNSGVMDNRNGSFPLITNSSFSANNATAGLRQFSNSASSPTITNSIFWGNSGTVPMTGGTISYSIVQGGWTGAGNNNLNVNPKFVTQPVIGGGTFGDLSLRDCSPAINTGDPATNPSIIGSIDLVGNPRVFGTIIDMGAYEFQTISVFNPTLAANPGLVIAPGGSTTLTVSPADSYLWSTSATAAAITVSPATTTTYTVTATSGTCSQMLTAVVKVAAPIWAGTESTAWNTPGNWESGTVPLTTHDVVIPSAPANQPVISTAAVAKSVAVNSGAVLTIGSAGSLTINESAGNGLTNNGTVNNSGALMIGNTGNIGSNGISNFGTFNNNTGGTISTDRFHDKGISNEGVTPNYSNVFTNNGQILTGTVIGNNFGIENAGTFVNAGGNINVGSANNSGIHNIGPFTNTGPITVKTATSGGPGRGIYNQNTFANNAGGSITINRSVYGILNEASFTNLATINIGNSTTSGEEVANGIGNTTPSGTFNNKGCLALITTSAIINSDSRPFANSGAIIESASANSSITSNSGVVQNLNGGTFAIGTNTGINTTSTGTITQANRLTVAVTPASKNITPGQQVTLTASGATSYTWNDASTANPLVVTPPNGQTTYTVTGLTGFCTGIASAEVTTASLPVTLISFDAKKQDNGSVQLAWATTSEIDNAYFELERSTDLKRTELLAKVAADERVSVTHNYSFNDELPYKGTSYYRLRQVDLDGQKTTFAWVSIVMDQVYVVFPNPVVNNKFQLTLDEPQTAVLKFYSVDGKQIPLQTVTRGAAMVDLKLPKNAIPGIYLLLVQERGQSRQYRVVVP